MVGMHEHNVPTIFRHPGAVYTNKRFASFAWSSSRIIHGACYYILYGPNQSPPHRQVCWRDGPRVIYHLRSEYIWVLSHCSSDRRLCLPVPWILGFMDLPQGVRPFSKDRGKEHEDKTSLRNIELPIHRYSQRKMK